MVKVQLRVDVEDIWSWLILRDKFELPNCLLDEGNLWAVASAERGGGNWWFNSRRLRRLLPCSLPPRPLEYQPTVTVSEKIGVLIN